MRLSRGQIAGLVAAGALVALAMFAFYTSREGASATLAERPAEPSPDSASGQSSVASPPEPLPGTQGPGALVTATVEQIMLSPQARILAERFKCVCGCEDILASCSCNETPGSRDMKKYLQQLVDEGKTPAEVEASMVERYGEAVRP